MWLQLLPQLSVVRKLQKRSLRGLVLVARELVLQAQLPETTPEEVAQADLGLGELQSLDERLDDEVLV